MWMQCPSATVKAGVVKGLCTVYVDAEAVLSVCSLNEHAVASP